MRNFAIALASAATLAIAACGEPADDTATMTTDDTAMADQMANADAATPGSIVEVAQGNNDYSTLVSAVQSANLGDTLSGPGPYTVFAPSNAAFEKIPQATRDELMSAAGQEQLASILQYHVVDGRVDAATLTQAIQDAGEAGYTINTLGGGTLTATMDGSNVVLTDATGGTSTVTATDIDASNGIIHGIDTVLMPS
ncbi:fasciclin domain-containing protein [Qipengyuania atrilutea]|uniref:Fasciclin domain-containing protein n=1 Tax=Qipengyuania atrilutea TaxID=2744473 RepID=A0A850H7P9_9SPHN|nr:fasciclin domain-containing protein [Actirhodobacter atriluteus]NVD45823.1 fasciclin domain-containing protein [Actirhodobacter atriluteus]